MPSRGNKYTCGDNVRLYVSWQYFPNASPSSSDASSPDAFDALPQLALTFDPPVVRAGKLFVKVLEAKHLPASQWLGTSDPFPEARLLPGNEKARMHACEDGGKGASSCLPSLLDTH